MAQTELMVNSREALGKGSARSLRREGLVPAVVYGKNVEPCALSVDPKALKKSISTEAGLNTLITLKGDGPFDGQVVILKDMQVDAVVGTLMHADFQVIDLAAKVSVMVPVHPVGKSAGEKEGGNLSVIRHEVEIVCLPSAIPASIDIDVTEMQIGDVVHVEDLQLGDGVEAPHDANFTILTVVGRMAEEVEGEELEEGVEGAEAVEAAPEADAE
ncbi:50S ribosomal protein L25 [Syntrophotalea acetylenivorans]|uniref:Large ribosomal subunit protein bL25 n=1 Tax=Syntrophotalea acetylenivorans TaxID=1842532 RepID=A0A1L3GKN2_9BACT|nr:50S ribosomal protein L25/general stress protein Ctc [Syntrophotalea acetylenivorans]APG26507.1 50S ribosomal protein L25 [Syntrophotalea acetylenivorans]